MRMMQILRLLNAKLTPGFNPTLSWMRGPRLGQAGVPANGSLLSGHARGTSGLGVEDL